MRVSFQSKLWWSSVAALLLCNGVGTASAQSSQQALEQKVDAYLAPLLRTNNFSGVITVAKGDAIVFAKGYGLASEELGVGHRPDTVFHIASVSKPFTSTAVMRLVETGKIQLHAPLTAILPAYPNGDKLTVHHLLTHTSGIPNINGFLEYEEMQFKEHSLKQLVAIFKDRPLLFAPGERHNYSNSNFNLLAHIIEEVSGKSFGRFLNEEIIDKAGLTSTGHPTGAGQIVPGLADGYSPLGASGLERARYVDWSVKTGNGSLYSSAPDIVRFLRAVHSGRLLRPESLKAAFTSHTPNVGYGWFITRANGRDIHHINGRSPGWAAQADYYVADEVSVVVLNNNYSSVSTPVARAVGALYLGAAPTPLPPLGTRLSKAEVAAILGTYQFGPDYYVPNASLTVTEAGGDIVAEFSTGLRTGLIPLSARTFMLRSFWSEAQFTTGADGRVNGLTMDDFLGRRIR